MNCNLSIAGKLSIVFNYVSVGSILDMFHACKSGIFEYQCLLNFVYICISLLPQQGHETDWLLFFMGMRQNEQYQLAPL